MSRERIQRRKLWMQMSGGVRVEVTLLDGRKLEFSVGARLLTQDLMSLVTSHFSLCESQYFALAYRDTSGHYHWLLDDRRLLDHDFARGVRILPLYFLVRFFPESVAELRDAQTVELFYQHARNIVGNGELEVDISTAVRLAALSLQASIGNFIDETSSKSFLKSSILPSANLLEHSLKHFSEEKVVGEHEQLIGLSRGDAILSYMRQIECVPGYGVHFYEVRDRSNVPWQLGISQKGILQYEFKTKKKPKRVFFWKQLENLYFRERKFSIEVHDPKRVVLALNSFNLYEGAIHDSVILQDDLLEAITEDTTQVSVSRRTFGPGSVSVCVWFAETQSLCKSIWSMAIAQHQFYLDRKTSRTKEGLLRVLQDPPDLAGELSRSCISLSTHSSSPNLSRSGSHSSLQHNTEDSASTESLHAARMEMLSALQQRYDSLHEKLEEKSEELRLLCLREGELTGELPPEYPRKPGEPLPVVRKRVGTSFSLDEALINRIINKQEETVASLELEYEIQAKIVSAGLRLANECSSRKGLRKQRKHSYYQASQRLLEIEQKLRQAKNRQAHVISNNASTMPKMKKKPRPVSDSEGLQDDMSVVGSALLSPHESLKEISFIDGVALSPPCNSSQSFAYLSQSKTNELSTLHSAPPSPQRNSLGQMSTSDCSSGQPSTTGSRSNSPARPSSGYIPSVVYTRNQYRAQHYPTLSTRGQSVPSENLQLQRSFNGGLYNLPQQRTSLASHSLDDLDSSNPNSPLLSTVKAPSHGQLPPHPHNLSYSNQQPHSQTPNRRAKNDSHDRFGSLDRRRATSGRFESRSMEHLDSLPSTSSTQTPMSGVNLSYYSPHPLHDLSYSHDPSEGQSHLVVVSHSTSQSFSNSSGESSDVVDGYLNCSAELSSHGDAYPTPSPQIMDGQFIKDVSCGRDVNGGRGNSQRLFRSQSGRGYLPPLEASIPMTGMESHFSGETPPFATNQENIPPSPASQPAVELLPPLRASNHRHPCKREGYSTNLRPTASVNAADHLRPFRIPATELPPLRPTKSSSELPPLKPTNGRLHNSSSVSPYYYSHGERSRENNNEDYPIKHRTPSADSSLKFVDGGSNDESWIPNGGTLGGPLMSLAEGAWLKKEQRIRSDSAAESPKSLIDSNHCQRHYEAKLHEHRIPSASHSVHNLSTSSSGSSGSVFQSANEGSDSLNSTLNTSSLNASLNATLTVISAGSYQPSREVSKPFEMSDFYKYSTKFRRKSSTSGSVSLENGSTEPISPTTNNNNNHPLSPYLPPKMSMLVSSTPNASNINVPTPPSPSVVAQNSSPAPQQKGLYQPLTPLTCKPLDEETPDLPEHLNKPTRGSWDHAPIHQAVPVNVTTKRSATLV